MVGVAELSIILTDAAHMATSTCLMSNFNFQFLVQSFEMFIIYPCHLEIIIVIKTLHCIRKISFFSAAR